MKQALGSCRCAGRLWLHRTPPNPSIGFSQSALVHFFPHGSLFQLRGR